MYLKGLCGRLWRRYVLSGDFLVGIMLKQSTVQTIHPAEAHIALKCANSQKSDFDLYLKKTEIRLPLSHETTTVLKRASETMHAINLTPECRILQEA